MNKSLENGLYTLAEDTGVLEGLVLGAAQGALEGAFLPSYFRQRLTSDDLDDRLFHFSQFTTTVNDYEKRLLQIKNNIPLGASKIGEECYSRLLKAEVMTMKPISSLVRWGLPIAMVTDLSDGSIDNVGYAAIPFALSALYEAGRVVYHRFTKKELTEP